MIILTLNSTIELELKIASGEFDCLNITSITLLGCSSVPKQGPKSMFCYKLGHGTHLELESSIGARITYYHVHSSSRMLIRAQTGSLSLNPWYISRNLFPEISFPNHISRKKLILWYGGAASSLFQTCLLFIVLFDQMLFELLFFGSMFDIKAICFE